MKISFLVVAISMASPAANATCLEWVKATAFLAKQDAEIADGLARVAALGTFRPDPKTTAGVAHNLAEAAKQCAYRMLG
jgi:hypothetical protein